MCWKSSFHRSWCVAFAYFNGVNTPTLSNMKLPIGITQYKVDKHEHSRYLELKPANPRIPLPELYSAFLLRWLFHSFLAHFSLQSLKVFFSSLRLTLLSCHCPSQTIFLGSLFPSLLTSFQNYPHNLIQ